MQRLYLLKLRSVALVTLLLAAIASLILLPGGLTAKAAPNWVLQWSDEFSGAANTGVNTSTWKYDTGKGIFGTGEIETMTNSTANVHQDGAGHLVITALRDGNGNWTSGRIETQRADFQPPVGGMMRVESSLQQPNLTGAAAAGYWPAYWMLGATLRTGGVWPDVGEWDVMEDINGRSSVFGTLHCGTNPGGPCHESTGIGSGERPCSGCQTALHTYAIEYDRSVSPEQLRWYLDGTNYFTLNSTAVDATTWSHATHRGNFIIYDLAMGGGFPAAFGGGPTSSTQSGGSMVVDYVRVFYSAASGPTNTPVPPTNTPTAGVLLSQGKPATASSFQTGNGVSNVNDGSLTTRWTASGATFPQWWKVDLGASHSLTRAVTDWYNASTRTYKDKIEVSSDNNTFTTVVDQTGRTATGNSTDNFSATGRYVRITVTGASAGWASFYEFQGFGN